VRLQVHMDATLQPARRIIARLLQEDAGFFREHHYLNPLGVDDLDQPMLQCFFCIYASCVKLEIFHFWVFCQKFLFSERCV
jgi:hypothetical protein